MVHPRRCTLDRRGVYADPVLPQFCQLSGYMMVSRCALTVTLVALFHAFLIGTSFLKERSDRDRKSVV